MNIYSIKPTRLYIKQCPVTKIKYFGKYTGEDIYDYPGSGVDWKTTLKQNNTTPTTLWVSEWYCDSSIKRFALLFSRLNHIVESEKWANKKMENGLDGGFEHINDDPLRSEKVRLQRLEEEKTEKGRLANKKRSTKLRKPKTNEHRKNIATYQTGTKWFNNGVIERKIKGEPPEGFCEGRLKKATF